MVTLDNLDIYEIILLVAIGIVTLFCGYRIKKIAFFIIWFLIGFRLVTIIMPTINEMVPQIVGNELWQNLLPIAGGLLLGLLGFTIEKICLSGICFALVMMITANYFGTEVLTLVIGAIIGVVVAGASTMLMKPAIIIATSLAGAYALTVVLLSVIPNIDQNIFYFPILIGITAVGSVVQFLTTKHVD